MGRLILFVAIVALLVAIVAIVLTITARLLPAGRATIDPAATQQNEGMMVPTPFQKITYVALIVLLFGVATGWLGGL